MSDNNASLTYATFRIHSSPNEAETKKQGRPIYDDTEVCEIRFAANKQTVSVFPAHEQCEWVESPDGIRERITYAQKYNDQYMKFKAGAAQAASGTPLEELTFLTQGKRLELKALNIHTAEALAALDGNPLRMLGMGGRTLKDQAQFYLDTAAKTVNASDMAGEIERLRKEIERMKAENKPKIGGKKAKPVEIAVETSETSTDEGDGVAVDGDQPEDPENPFNDWEPEDIANWIREADAEYEIDGRWSKNTLAAKAKELNDKIAKARS